MLEDPAQDAPDYVYQRTVNPRMRPPDTPSMWKLPSNGGDAVSIDGVAMSPATLLTRLNELGHKHGIGRLDFVENRFVGMKSRGIYETPGGTILLGGALRDRADQPLDSGAGHLKDSLMPRYSRAGSTTASGSPPEREMLQAAHRQEPGACHPARCG